MIQPNSWKIQMPIVETTLRHYDLRWATEVRRAVMLKPKEGYKPAEKPETHSGRM
jgi:hypothetical protein